PLSTNEPKKKNIKHSENVKPPTLEEIKELRDTRNLFHSNLFKLQVKEMLDEIQLKPKVIGLIGTWLETLTAALEKLDDGLLDTCQLEVPLHLNKKSFNFQFFTPSSPPKLIGAAATGTLLGPKIVVDVALEMPAACFQKDDYLNLVYDQKRALYLASVASKIKQLPAFSADKFDYNYHANNPLKPVLEMTSASKLGNHVMFRLFITASPDIFQLRRFVPWNNNIRPSVFGDKCDKKENQTLPSTQHYNSNVLFDLTLAQNQTLLLNSFTERRNFQEGLLLLKVWLRQRQLDVGYSGFSAHILAAYIVYLSQNRLLHHSSSSYQVARTVWNQLANSDWSQGITLAQPQPQQLPISTLAAYFDVCFMDATGYFNLCANVPLAVYKAVCAEAKLAVELLNDITVNNFSHIFMQKSPLYSRMDNFLKITKAASVDQLLQLHVQPHFKYDYADYAYPQLLKLLTDLLQKGLGQRVHAILPLEVPSTPWSVDTKAPVIGRGLHLGLILDPEHAYEVLNKGPSANEDPDGAAEFRKFWGDKSNLRRFQDGSIAEAVVWGAATDAPSQKRLIVRQMVLHLLEHQLQLEPKDVTYVAGELDVVYSLTPSFKVVKLQTKLKQETDAEDLTPHVIHCYDALARQLHNLGDLPLEIVSISGISSIFRYCEPEPTLPQSRMIADRMHASQVLDVIIQLGPSGKWPNELDALRSLKTAFLIQIGQQLESQHKLHWMLCEKGLMVIKQGYCFLLQLAHSKELALLKQKQTERGVITYVDNPASRALERRHYILPRVNGALHALHQSHRAFGPTVLIAKRWLAAQLLDEGLWPSIATELLVAHIFQHRQSPHSTVSPQSGFIRFLQLLAHTEWNCELFLLNFNNTWTEKQLTNLEHSYRSERQNYPPLCLATAYDQQHAGRLWTNDELPNKPVLARVTLLARHALQLMESSLLSQRLGFVRPTQLFVPSAEGYDLVIHLKPDLVANTLCFDFGSPFAPLSHRNFRLPLAGSQHLAKIVEQLRAAYSEHAAFFYNPYGGKELAIIWRPTSEFAPKPFKVNDLQASTPCSGGQVQVDRDTLLEDFKLILKDFYLRITTTEELKREKRESSKPNRYFNDTSKKPLKMKKKVQAVQLKKSKKRLIKSKSLTVLR
ncbi:hypothetical protein KR044_000288, partial [Drosophila immigrans]